MFRKTNELAEKLLDESRRSSFRLNIHVGDFLQSIGVYNENNKIELRKFHDQIRSDIYDLSVEIVQRMVEHLNKKRLDSL